MKDRLKKLFETRVVQQVICTVLAILLYTLFVAVFKPSLSEWLNSVTDVFMGVVLGQIVFSLYSVLIGDKKYCTWQYFLGAIVSVGALGAFFASSRATTKDSLYLYLAIVGVLLVLYVLVRKFLYEPSTLTFEETQTRTWEYMKNKADKLGRAKFLDWEKSFRAYPTDSHSVKGNLDFTRPYGMYEVDGVKIPLTFNKAKDLGKNELAVVILDDLVKELDADGIK